MGKAKIVDTFQNPRTEFRGKPFWAWNGKLEKEELLRQIDNAKKMGFGGFFMHSRCGLDTKYLGEEWFELINACADYSKEIGLQAWLYDEDRWPSGTTGGEVTINPANRMRHIRMIPDANVEPNSVDQQMIDQALAAFVVKVGGNVLQEYTRVYSLEEASADKGNLYLFIEEEMRKSSFYNGYTYADTLNADTTQCFLESTHEKYVEACGDRIGDSILGMFTDEPNRGGLMTSFGQGSSSGEYEIPYTGKMPEKFKELYGYDMIDNLPELFLCKNPDKIAKIKWQYVELVQELFLDNYAKPIDKYCREHKMILTGHILHEDSLTCQTAMSGSMMRYYEYMEYPGIDFLGEQGRCYWIAKQLQSVARQQGKKMLLSELNGCTGWQMKLENYKAIGDWQALYGINLRCPHLSWYTMEGEAKRDCPASLFHQSAWWEESAIVEDYFARIAEFRAVGTPECHVLVLNPVESFWAQIHPFWCQGLGAKDEHLKDLEQQYANTFYWLQQAHIDFDYGDEGQLPRYARVENGKLIVGKASYEVVVISGMDTIRSTTIKLLIEFAAQGGKIVVCGKAPAYQDCEPVEWNINSIQVDCSREALIAPVSEYALSITHKDDLDANEILCQVNKQDDTTYIMMLNDNREEETEVTLRIKADGVVTRFIPENGELVLLKSKKVGEFLEVDCYFEAAGTMLLTIGQAFAKEKTLDKKVSVVEKKLKNPHSYILDESNICVLDQVKVSIDGADYSKPINILDADRKVRDLYKLPYRSGEMLQPWYINKHKVHPNGTVRLQYIFYVESLPEQDITLVVEQPEYVGLRCNNNELTYILNDYYWADICFKAVNIPKKFLKVGKNVISAEHTYFVTTNLEGMFLQGDFGVRVEKEKCILTTMPKELYFGDITKLGLPFYSGKVTYHCKLPKELDGRVKVTFDKMDSACIIIEGNGLKKTIAFHPYEADVTELVEEGCLTITAVLVRRNTFGPLHEVVTAKEGGYKTDLKYTFIENGIINEPVISYEIEHNKQV